jgi:hypothetical protein
LEGPTGKHAGAAHHVAESTQINMLLGGLGPGPGTQPPVRFVGNKEQLERQIQDARVAAASTSIALNEAKDRPAPSAEQQQLRAQLVNHCDNATRWEEALRAALKEISMRAADSQVNARAGERVLDTGTRWAWNTVFLIAGLVTIVCTLLILAFAIASVAGVDGAGSGAMISGAVGGASVTLSVLLAYVAGYFTRTTGDRNQATDLRGAAEQAFRTKETAVKAIDEAFLKRLTDYKLIVLDRDHAS